MKKNRASTKLPAKVKVSTPKINTKIVLKSFEKQAKPLINKLSTFKIKSPADYTKAFELTKELKEIAKDAKAKLGSIVDPVKQIKLAADVAIKNANDFFQPFFDDVNNIDQSIKIAMLNWQTSLAGKKKQLEKSFESGKIKTASTFVKKVGELEQSEGIRMVWQAVEKDRAKTPKKYWVVDEDAVIADLKAGKTVSGWSWEQVQTIAI